MLAEVRAFLDLSRERHSYSANTLRAIQEDLLRFSSYLVTNLGRPAELGDFNREQIAGFLRSEGLRPVGVRTLLRRQTSLRVFARYLRRYHPDGDFAPPEAITLPQECSRKASLWDPLTDRGTDRGCPNRSWHGPRASTLTGMRRLCLYASVPGSRWRSSSPSTLRISA